MSIFSTAANGLIVWLLAGIRGMFDRRTVYHWLESNTRDEPGESHVDTVTIAKATGLPEDRVRRACMSDRCIYRFPSEPELWSVWRKEPQSIYEKRGFLTI